MRQVLALQKTDARIRQEVSLREIAAELGVEIQRVAPEGGQEFYHVNGRLYTQQDMIGADGQGGFARLAPRIAEDQAKLLDAEENWTDHARALDQVSLADYLARLSNLAPAWAMELRLKGCRVR